MATVSETYTTLDKMISEAAKLGIIHHTAEDVELDGRTVLIEGASLIQFGSCSYLGLETDPRLKQGAIDATRRYGTQFSSSRTYLSAPPYRELDAAMEALFGHPALVCPTTTLAHLSALPVLIGERDAVVLDQQVHHSVQVAANQVRGQGAHLEVVRHNRMDLLEERIVALQRDHRRVWYLADGLYSMYGDLAPLEALSALLERYESLHVYCDDAHGMSWSGRHGRGYVLGHMALHERMVVAASGAKAFGVGGGFLVFPNEEWRRKVKTCGGPMIFSGPLQPPLLGAALASAQIHLSDEIDQLQAELMDRIRYCNDLLAHHQLPVVGQSDAPIRFIGVGLPRVAYALVARLKQAGFFTNAASFPAVPMKKAGVRFTLTRHQSLEDIRHLVEAIAEHLPEAVAQEGRASSANAAEGAHSAIRFVAKGLPPAAKLELTVKPAFTLHHETTIEALPAAEWDSWLGRNGSFSWEGLRFLEATFKNRPEPENNWKFHYYVVRDAAGVPVLATFFTESLWKDDMLETEAVSRAVESQRSADPSYLTSRNLAMGSLLTEGEHLYLDRRGDWRGAMDLLLKAIAEEQGRACAQNVVLRDLPADDPEMEAFLLDQGFVKVSMPESLCLDIDWHSEEEYINKLSFKSRRHQRGNVAPWNDAYELEVLSHAGRQPTGDELAHFCQLYRNVKANSLELNTFDLPESLFEQMLRRPCWELVTLRLKPEYGGDRGLVHGIVASFIGPEQYAPMVIGLDYRFVQTHGLYRQFLRQMVRRAEHHGSRRVLYGMGASFEKRRFGAKVQPRCAYFQATEHYALEVLALLRAEQGGK